MREFSMYERALELARSSDFEDMGDVAHVSRRDFDERRTIIFRAQVPCLEYLSLLIENAVLLRTNRAGRVYAGFEKLSRMEAVTDRFLRIADVSERLYIFGEPDWKPPRHPHMRLITLSDKSKLASEWFVIADSPTMRVALVGVDKDGFNAPVLEHRHFHAIKSHDPALVEQLTATAEDLIVNSLAA